MAPNTDRPLQPSMRGGYATASNDSHLPGARLPSTMIPETLYDSDPTD